MPNLTDSTRRCWAYQVTPVYTGIYRDRGDPETIVDQVSLGRKQLGTLWWKGCTCLAYLPESIAVCNKICRPLRRNVQFLSRRLLALHNDTVSVHPGCKYPELVHIRRLAPTAEEQGSVVVTFDVSFGKGNKHWMRFLIDAVPAISEEAMLTTASNENKRLDSSLAIEPFSLQPLSEAASPSRQPVTPCAAGTPKKRKRTDKELYPKRLLFSEEASQKIKEGKLTSRDEPHNSLDSSTEHGATTSLHNCVSPSASRSTLGANESDSPSRRKCRRRLWSTKMSATGKQASQDEESYLSLPMPSESDLESGYFSLSMQEETQYADWTVENPMRKRPRRCDALSVEEWRALRGPSSQSARTFRETMIDLVMHKNEGKCSQEPLWLPDMLKDTTLG